MARKKVTDDKARGLERALRGMFRKLENRPVPDRIRSVVDQLDEGADQDDLKKSG